MSSAVAQRDVERVLGYLEGHWDDFSKAPPEEEIMRDLGLTRRLVKEAIAQLEDTGRIHPGTLMPYQESDAHSPSAMSDDATLPFGTWDEEE